MKRMQWLAGAVLVPAVAIGVFAARGERASSAAHAAPVPAPAAATPQQPAEPGQRVEVPPPPFTEGIFPCSFCHSELTPNPTRRDLTEEHTDIKLSHDEQHRWCLDCHDAADRDSLHLASGEKVPFEESYRLCGQCHGEKYRDWRSGVHGRRTGQWNGPRQYLLCAHCHNPHQPRFQPYKPDPAPQRPTRPSGW
jgi:hypothetical protein